MNGYEKKNWMVKARIALVYVDVIVIVVCICGFNKGFFPGVTDIPCIHTRRERISFLFQELTHSSF